MGSALRISARAANAAVIAGNAAKRSAELAENVETAKLYIYRAGLSLSEYPSVQFDVMNVGRTPAFMIEYGVHLHYFTELPASPRYLVKTPSRRVIRPGKSMSDLPARIYGYVGIAGEPSPLSERMPIYMIGYFIFEDVFGKRRQSGFCYRFDSKSNHLIRAGGSAYNYDRPDAQEKE
jgi:hypothetical protein